MSSLFTAQTTWRACAAVARMVLGIAVACTAAHARAQPHQVSQDGYTVRASTTSTTMIDPRTARRHDMTRAPGHGILNVTVSHEGPRGRRPVAAHVDARIQDLAGTQRDVRMREVARGRYVSYAGTYDFAPRAVLDFHVEARPQGSDLRIVLTFRERMPER